MDRRSVIPLLRNLRQEECHESKANLGYPSKILPQRLKDRPKEQAEWRSNERTLLDTCLTGSEETLRETQIQNVHGDQDHNTLS